MDRTFIRGTWNSTSSTSCHIHLPLTTDCLREVIFHLQSLSQYNFYSYFISIRTKHYHTILQKFMFCPVSIAFCHSCTGKTTALHCGLSMCGVYPTRFFSKASLEKYNSLCCDSQSPLGIDDPKSKASISDLAIYLFNGVRGGTMKHGEIDSSKVHGYHCFQFYHKGAGTVSSQ